MFRKILATAICTTVFFAAAASAGPTMDFYFPSNPENDPQKKIALPENPLGQTLHFQCSISSENESNEIQATMLQSKGSVNGTELSAGDSINVVVYNGDTLTMSANYKAKVEINNLGSKTVKATCWLYTPSNYVFSSH